MKIVREELFKDEVRGGIANERFQQRCTCHSFNIVLQDHHYKVRFKERAYRFTFLKIKALSANVGGICQH